MYQALRDGLRAATHVEIVQFKDPTTHEIVIRVSRKGQTLWAKRYNDFLLVTSGAKENIVHEVNAASIEAVNRVLGEVDWNTFY